MNSHCLLVVLPLCVASHVLCVRARGSLVVCGPQTTLISMLAGELPISGGVALVAGHDCATEMATVRQSLGVVPQFDALFGHLTPRQHLSLFARLAGIQGAVRVTNAVAKVIEQLELSGDSLDRPAKLLSGGQRRRLSLGLAIVGNSRVLFLDEVRAMVWVPVVLP